MLATTVSLTTVLVVLGIIALLIFIILAVSGRWRGGA